MPLREKKDAKPPEKEVKAAKEAKKPPQEQGPADAPKTAGNEGEGLKQSEIDKFTEKDVSINKLVDYMIEQAYQMRASDVHINPAEKEVDIRFRIDGVMKKIFSLPKVMLNQIITTIKVNCGLRTDEHQAAQDGRFRLLIGDTPVDLRVSIIPSYHGEDAVIRLLVAQVKAFTLEELGFAEHDKALIQRYIHRPHGMILATGPTGSGKTTTLYTVLQMLNTPDVSITTIEDPIEYSMAGITQIQVNSATNLTFAKGLRSIVRQDPNIIMVGEIRDDETASIAVNAALTGHLLLSTIHTNDAATTLPRLLDMGIEPFLVASTVNIAIGQRLVRKICEGCKEEYRPTDAEKDRLRAVVSEKIWKTYDTFFIGKGCNVCGGSGYKGRVGIYEVLEVRDEIRDLIVSKASSDAIQQTAVKNGMTTMLEDGFAKAGQGQTSVAEVLRVIQE
jgi:type II secretory ATPase GspE/PulE/Tfp pilus assembly ATPase PilB-like protein